MKKAYIFRCQKLIVPLKPVMWGWDVRAGAGEREDEYLHLNLASVLWFGCQTTFIFLQHTHTCGGKANNKFGDFSYWTDPCEHHCASIHAHNHTRTRVTTAQNRSASPKSRELDEWLTLTLPANQISSAPFTTPTPFFPIMPLSFQHLSTQTTRLHRWLRQCSRGLFNRCDGLGILKKTPINEFS